MIQTPEPVWTKLLELCPVEKHEFFYEPFKGDGNLYNQINTTNKEWSEIMQGRDVFDFPADVPITTIFTNPPFKTELTNKKGIKKLKNCVYYFIEYFILKFVSLKRIGFLMNAKSFESLTPKRLQRLSSLGFDISKIIVLNIQCWFGRYYFLVFERNITNKPVISIPTYF
jgi:hypothetical protein